MYQLAVTSNLACPEPQDKTNEGIFHKLCRLCFGNIKAALLCNSLL